MQVRIHGSFASIVLRPWYEAPLDLVGRASLDVAQLRSLIVENPGAVTPLRRLVSELEPQAAGLDLQTDEQLARTLARLIERGLVRVEAEPRPLIYTTPVEDTALPEHVVEPLAPVDETEHWIEVQLLGEDDEGIAGARCRIVLPSGRTIVRTTDRFGLVRIDGVENAGDCEISFPDLDSEAWEPL